MFQAAEHDSERNTIQAAEIFSWQILNYLAYNPRCWLAQGFVDFSKCIWPNITCAGRGELAQATLGIRGAKNFL
jgi:hypothetical protein